MFESWYTDLVDVYRVLPVVTGNVSKQERIQVLAGIPCRVYNSQINNINLKQGAAVTRGTDKLACDVRTDIQPGDELIVTRGGSLGDPQVTERYIASRPQIFRDPVGGALTGLEHMEVGLTFDSIVRAKEEV